MSYVATALIALVLPLYSNVRACSACFPMHVFLAFALLAFCFSRCMHVTCRACLTVRVLHTLMFCLRFVLVDLCMLACACLRSVCSVCPPTPLDILTRIPSNISP